MEALPLDAITVELPRNPDHGDVATNAAMVLAKPLRSNPRELANKIAQKLNELPHISAVEIAGPGFINLRLSPAFWQKLIPSILTEKTRYGQSQLGNSQSVNIEYVSANPTGPMHIGHARGAIIGDALASLMEKAGYKVTREYYVNDAGAQIETLARSALLRYREALGDEIGDIPEGLYPGDYLIPVGKALRETYGKALLQKPEAEALSIIRDFAVEQMLELIRADLAQLGIHHDVFSSEKALSEAGKVDEVLHTLDKMGLIYTGVLEPPKGKEPEDWEPRPQTLFKSTDFGDDVDRALKKSDGSWTYFAPDIAYHYDKINRGYDQLVNVFGADHGGYVKRITAAVKALSENRVPLSVKLCQLVRFMRGGEVVKMSKRAGSFITVRDVVDEVGKDALRFIMLTRKNDAALDFDLEKAVEKSKDNPVFYVQYAHARCHSAMRLAGYEDPDSIPTQGDFSALNHPADLAIIRKMAQWPVLVEQAARASEAHRVAFYAQELAADFHELWNLGHQEPKLRFLQDDATQQLPRIQLVRAVSLVLQSALDIVGVQAVREM